MHITILIAQIFAVIYCCVGVGMVLNSTYYYEMIQEMQERKLVVYISGVLALLAGFLIVSNHNIWMPHWSLLITIFGWLALLKGVVLLVAPQKMCQFAEKMVPSAAALRRRGILAIVLGGFFSYVGFCPYAF